MFGEALLLIVGMWLVLVVGGWIIDHGKIIFPLLAVAGLCLWLAGCGPKTDQIAKMSAEDDAACRAQGGNYDACRKLRLEYRKVNAQNATAENSRQAANASNQMLIRQNNAHSQCQLAGTCW